jgi:integrase
MGTGDIARVSATTRDPSRSGKDLVKKPLESLVNDYLIYKRCSNSVRTMRTRERRVLQPLRPLLRRLPTEIDALQIATALTEWCNGKSPSTCRAAIQEVKALWVWLAEEDHITTQPWDHKVLKRLPRQYPKRKKVRPQFRVDEAAKLYDYLLGVAADDPAAMVALLCLVAGFRLGEVLGLQARGIDAGGSLVWVDDAKTEAGQRQAQIPAPVDWMLGEYKKGLHPSARVFPYTADQVRPRIKKHYAMVGVPILDVHALRRTNATLRVLGGETSDVVIKQLGHTDFSMTENHYVAPGTLEDIGQKNVAKLLNTRHKRDPNTRNN